MSLLGRWSTSGSEAGNAHFLPLQEYDRGNNRTNRTNEQTRTMLGVNSRAERGVMQHYISDSIYGLTIVWITSENSTKQLECRHLDSIFFAGPYLLLTRLSAVPSPTLLSSFLQPTLFRVPLPLPDTARFQVQKPFVWFRAKTDKGIVCLAGPPM